MKLHRGVSTGDRVLESRRFEIDCARNFGVGGPPRAVPPAHLAFEEQACAIVDNSNDELRRLLPDSRTLRDEDSIPGG